MGQLAAGDTCAIVPPRATRSDPGASPPPRPCKSQTTRSIRKHSVQPLCMVAKAAKRAGTWSQWCFGLGSPSTVRNPGQAGQPCPRAPHLLPIPHHPPQVSTNLDAAITKCIRPLSSTAHTCQDPSATDPAHAGPEPGPPSFSTPYSAAHVTTCQLPYQPPTWVTRGLTRRRRRRLASVGPYLAAAECPTAPPALQQRQHLQQQELPPRAPLSPTDPAPRSMCYQALCVSHAAALPPGALPPPLQGTAEAAGGAPALELEGDGWRGETVAWTHPVLQPGTPGSPHGTQLAHGLQLQQQQQPQHPPPLLGRLAGSPGRPWPMLGALALRQQQYYHHQQHHHHPHSCRSSLLLARGLAGASSDPHSPPQQDPLTKDLKGGSSSSSSTRSRSSVREEQGLQAGSAAAGGPGNVGPGAVAHGKATAAAAAAPVFIEAAGDKLTDVQILSRLVGYLWPKGTHGCSGGEGVLRRVLQYVPWDHRTPVPGCSPAIPTATT